MSQPVQPRSPLHMYEHRWSWSEEQFQYREILLNTSACYKLWTGEHTTAILEYDSNMRKLVCVRTIGGSQTDELPRPDAKTK